MSEKYSIEQLERLITELNGCHEDEIDARMLLLREAVRKIQREGFSRRSSMSKEEESFAAQKVRLAKNKIKSHARKSERRRRAAINA